MGRMFLVALLLLQLLQVPAGSAAAAAGGGRGASLELGGRHAPETQGKAYPPRSYWRFENASDLRQDSRHAQALSSFESIGVGEVHAWRSQAEGGVVGGSPGRKTGHWARDPSLGMGALLP